MYFFIEYISIVKNTFKEELEYVFVVSIEVKVRKKLKLFIILTQSF